MQAALDLSQAGLQAALIELFMHSLVTNDHLETLHQILRTDPPAEPKAARFQSSLETQLAERRQGQRRIPARPTLRRPSRPAYEAAKRRVQERLGQSSPTHVPEQPLSQGRWSLVHRLGVLGRAVSAEEQVARQSRQLLQRWGVVTRAALEAEEGDWHWSTLYQYLHLLEMRGEVRRGYFVQGLPGPQFALPDVVEQLREQRDQTNFDDQPLILLNACDPANLYGPTLDDGPMAATGRPLTFSRLPSTGLVQQRGQPVLLIEGNGSTITTAQTVDEGLLRRALQIWLTQLGRLENRLTVQTWNEQPILDSEGQPLLESLGFRRDYPLMTWEKSY
jgi:ATP-dependent Lhr-like helicase